MRLLRAAVLGGVIATACHSKPSVSSSSRLAVPSTQSVQSSAKAVSVASTPEARWEAVQPILGESASEFRFLKHRIEDHEQACLDGKKKETRACIDRSVAAHTNSYFADGECIDAPLQWCAGERTAFQQQEVGWRTALVAAAGRDYPAHTDPNTYEDVYANPQSEQRASLLNRAAGSLNDFHVYASDFSIAHQSPDAVFKLGLDGYAINQEHALSSGENPASVPNEPVAVRAVFKIIDGIFSVLNTIILTFLSITAALFVIGVGAVLGWHTNDLYRDGTVARIWDSENTRVQRPILKYLRAACQIFLQAVLRTADRWVALLASSESPSTPSPSPPPSRDP